MSEQEFLGLHTNGVAVTEGSGGDVTGWNRQASNRAAQDWQ